MTTVTIHEQHPPDAVLPQVVRDAEERNRGEKHLSDQNLELERSDLVLLAVGAVGEFGDEEGEGDSEDGEGEPGEGGGERGGLAEAEESEEVVEPVEVVFEFGVG